MQGLLLQTLPHMQAAYLSCCGQAGASSAERSHVVEGHTAAHDGDALMPQRRKSLSYAQVHLRIAPPMLVSCTGSLGLKKDASENIHTYWCPPWCGCQPSLLKAVKLELGQ